MYIYVISIHELYWSCSLKSINEIKKALLSLKRSTEITIVLTVLYRLKMQKRIINNRKKRYSHVRLLLRLRLLLTAVGVVVVVVD